jgi:antitoxin component of RelBE/YafQ-DinJ toxin-antitoxin module
MRNRTTFRIDDTLKLRFNKLCEEVGVSCSEMLRRMILLIVSEDNKYDILKKRGVIDV